MASRTNICEEVHIQKAVYFLQTIFSVPLGYEYILYKCGPFSFDLSDELMKIRANGLLKVVPTSPIGLTFHLQDGSSQLCGKFPRTIGKFSPAIKFLTAEIGKQGVKELARLATLNFLNARHEKKVSSGDLIGELIELKPHISREGAEEAVKAIADIKLRWSRETSIKDDGNASLQWPHLVRDNEPDDGFRIFQQK